MHYKQHRVIEVLTVKRVLPTEIHHQVQVVYGYDCVDMSMLSAGPKTVKMVNQEELIYGIKNEVDDL